MFLQRKENRVSDKLVIIDLSYLMHRSFKAGNEDAYPHADSATNIVLRTIERLERDLSPGKMQFALECGYLHRMQISRDYKGDRGEKDPILISEIDHAIRILHEKGYEMLYAEDLEADDVMATVAFRCGNRCVVVTADKDIHQLASICSIYDPYKKNFVTEQSVLERWGVAPGRLGDVLALMGDEADCIPGVFGIGPKTAAMLIKEHGSLSKVVGIADQMAKDTKKVIWKKISTGKDDALMSRNLVQLVIDANIKVATKEQMPWSEFRRTFTNSKSNT